MGLSMDQPATAIRVRRRASACAPALVCRSSAIILVAVLALLSLGFACAPDEPGTMREAAEVTRQAVPSVSPRPDATVPPTRAASSPKPRPPSSPTAPSASPFDGTRGVVEKAATPAPPVVLLSEVRIGRHAGYDRVVFEFEGALPGYRVRYVQPPILADGSGLPVAIEGSAFLEVTFRPASGYDFERNRPAYAGPREFTENLPVLVELERTGDFEAVLTWVLGLRREVDFRVLELGDPARVVVDVAHPRP